MDVSSPLIFLQFSLFCILRRYALSSGVPAVESVAKWSRIRAALPPRLHREMILAEVSRQITAYREMQQPRRLSVPPSRHAWQPLVIERVLEHRGGRSQGILRHSQPPVADSAFLSASSRLAHVAGAPVALRRCSTHVAG